jgi:hypothetical protein
MTVQRLLCTIVLSTLLLFSCSLEKRVYMPGYHVEWRHATLQQQALTPDSTNATMTSPYHSHRETLVHVPLRDDVRSGPSDPIGKSPAGSDVVLATVADNSTAHANIPAQQVSTTIITESGVQMPAMRSVPREEGSVRLRGTLMIIAALALMALALVFYGILGPIGVVLAVLFAIGGVVYLVSGFVVLFS